jgi:hypothetical protein
MTDSGMVLNQRLTALKQADFNKICLFFFGYCLQSDTEGVKSNLISEMLDVLDLNENAIYFKLNFRTLKQQKILWFRRPKEIFKVKYLSGAFS